MRKTGFIISFLLTFIIMLSAAVMPFASDGIKTDVYQDKKEIAPESEKEESFSEEKTEEKEIFYDNSADETVNYTETENEAQPGKMPVAAAGNDKKTVFAADPDKKLYDYKPGAPGEITKELSGLGDNKGILTEKKSIHAYVFSLTDRGMFRYKLSHEEIKGTEGWNVSLYQEYFLNGVDGETGWRLINVLSSAIGKTTDKSPFIGLAKGSYRLVVTPRDSIPYMQYNITVTFEEGNSYETECNDNVYRYNEIYSDIPLTGSASALPGKQDADYYMFRMFSDGYANFSFEHRAEDGLAVLWQISVFTEDGQEVYGINSSAGDRILYSGNIGLRAGNYFISVKNRVYTDKTYKLTFGRSKNIMFEKEFNDSFEQAQKIQLNSFVSGSLSSRLKGIDRDYFEFNVPEKGFVNIEFWHVNIPVESDEREKPGWNIKIYSSDRSVRYSMQSFWDSDVIATQTTGLTPGKYYVSVDCDDIYHSHEQYSVYVNFNINDSWETEPNNSFETADELKDNKPVWGSLAENSTEYDNDYYTFTLSETKDVSVIFAHDRLKYSKDIFMFTLYDKNMHKVGYTDGAGNTVFDVNIKSDIDKTEVRYNTLPAGKYYIQVSTGLFFDRIQYSLLYKCE